MPSPTRTFLSKGFMMIRILTLIIIVIAYASISIGGECRAAMKGTPNQAPQGPIFLTVNISGNGGGMVTSDRGDFKNNRINCTSPNGTNCSLMFPPGSVIYLTQTPDSSSTFASWNGCNSVTNDNRCEIRLSSYNKSVTVNFNLNCAATDAIPCSSAYDLGPVHIGMVTSNTGVITRPGQDKYYKVSFPWQIGGGTPPGAPTIRLHNNPNNEYRLEIFGSSCGTATWACGSGGRAAGVTSYAFDTTVYLNDGRNLCPWPGFVYFRVYRITSGNSCLQYTVQVSR
jgi:hypothetical protein